MRLVRLVGIACFGYVLVRPVSSNQVLLPVLATLGLIATATWVVRRGGLAAPLQPLVFVQLAFGLYGTLVGALHPNPGLVYGALVYLAAPVLFWACVAAMSERSLQAVLRWTAIVTGVLSIGILAYVAGQRGIVPQVVPAAFLEQSGAGFNELGDATAIRLYGLSTLVAAAPLWTASLLVPADRLMPSAGVRVYAAVSSIAAALVAGRRGLVVVLIATPVLTWACSRILTPPAARAAARRRRGGRRVLVGVAALVLTAAAASAPSLFNGAVVGNALRATTDLVHAHHGLPRAEDADIRRVAADELLTTWRQSPVTGQGFGAVVHGYARSSERPWNFELQYHLQLLQTGLVGVVLGLVMLGIAVAALRRATRADPGLAGSVVVTSVGAAAMLVANASNPYLQAPGHMWAVYLPLAVANVALSRTSRRDA